MAPALHPDYLPDMLPTTCWRRCAEYQCHTKCVCVCVHTLLTYRSQRVLVLRRHVRTQIFYVWYEPSPIATDEIALTLTRAVGDRAAIVTFGISAWATVAFSMRIVLHYIGAPSHSAVSFLFMGLNHGTGVENPTVAAWPAEEVRSADGVARAHDVSLASVFGMQLAQRDPEAPELHEDNPPELLRKRRRHKGPE